MIARNPKGFRDFLPADALKRQMVIDKIKQTFQKFGFDPLETPTVEFAETLQGKYGEEEKLIYQFETRGGDKVALKYDQTVPLARVVAQYPELAKPFKRYQIQDAYRGENTQKGRYRQFLQCDADIVGVSTPLADAEILALVYEIYQNLGLEVMIKINDRGLLSTIEPKYLATIDKLLKIGDEGVLVELTERGLNPIQAQETLDFVKNLQPTPNLTQIQELFSQMGYPEDAILFDPTLVRGLDYYTGLILEVVLRANPLSSSLCGGGRWDTMIGKFTGQDQPAVGFAVGLDRTIEAMQEMNVLEAPTTGAKVLVTVFASELLAKSLAVAQQLRKANINTEVWLEPGAKLEKQLKYANNKGIPYAVIIGPEEAATDQVVLKNLAERTQESITLRELIEKLSS